MYVKLCQILKSLFYTTLIEMVRVDEILETKYPPGNNVSADPTGGSLI